MAKKKTPKKKTTPKKKAVEKEVVEEVEAEVKEERVPTRYEKVMEKSKRYNKDGTVRAVVMTEAGSQIADEARRNNTGTLRNQDCIHKPKG